MYKISEFLSENFQFLEVKNSICLSKRVFIMSLKTELSLSRCRGYVSLQTILLPYEESQSNRDSKFCSFMSFFISKGNIFRFEPAHNKTYNKTCVTSKYLDQLVHPPSMAKILFHSSFDSLEAVVGTYDRRRL